MHLGFSILYFDLNIYRWCLPTEYRLYICNSIQSDLIIIVVIVIYSTSLLPYLGLYNAQLEYNK